jgi:hypothetical protein
MYTYTNFKTKKAFKEAVAKGEEVRVYQPGGMFNPPEASPTYTGKAVIEGPHYPAPHTWYASVDLVEGTVTKVR